MQFPGTKVIQVTIPAGWDKKRVHLWPLTTVLPVMEGDHLRVSTDRSLPLRRQKYLKT